MKRSKKAGHMMKSILIAYLLTAIVLLAFSFLMYKMKISIAGAGAGILLTYVISCLVGGFVYSGAHEEKKYLGGGILGMVYFIIVYCVSAWWNRSLAVAMPGILTAFFVCVLAGMLGGMLRAGMR